MSEQLRRGERPRAGALPWSLGQFPGLLPAESEGWGREHETLLSWVFETLGILVLTMGFPLGL